MVTPIQELDNLPCIIFNLFKNIKYSYKITQNQFKYKNDRQKRFKSKFAQNWRGLKPQRRTDPYPSSVGVEVSNISAAKN